MIVGGPDMAPNLNGDPDMAPNLNGDPDMAPKPPTLGAAREARAAPRPTADAPRNYVHTRLRPVRLAR